MKKTYSTMTTSGPKPSVIFFGNEKLATGIKSPEPLILQSVKDAGFPVEKVITGPLSDLGSHTSKLAVLAAYGRIIPQSVIDQFPLGIVNVHPSLLPQYRGPTPIEQAMLDGVQKTGVSIMKLSAGMDEGPLYKQQTVHLNGAETKQELTSSLQALGAKLTAEVLQAIASNEAKTRAQPHPGRATYTKKLVKGDGIIDWSKPATDIEREVRAFAGWPKSSTKIAKKDVVIISSLVSSFEGIPGTVVLNNKGIHICCGRNSLQILELQPAGKNIMTSEAFLAGHRHILNK